MKTFFISAISFFIIHFGFPMHSNCAPGEFAKSGISVGVVVEDLDKALAFYTEVIGMVQTFEFSVDEAKSKELGLSNGDRFDVKVLKLEDSDNAPEWKLMTFGKKANHPKPQYVPDDTGMQYITIFVKSMKPFIERIKEHNVKMLGKTPCMLDANRQFVLVQDPDGNFIELIGPPN